MSKQHHSADTPLHAPDVSFHPLKIPIPPTMWTFVTNPSQDATRGVQPLLAAGGCSERSPE